MITDSSPCQKCGKLIIRSNLMLHENTCRGLDDFIQEEINQITQNNSNISSNNSQNIPDHTLSSHYRDEGLYHCVKCDMYFDVTEKGDHILSHQYEYQLEEEEEPSEEEEHEGPIRNYQHRNVPSINSNVYHENNNSSNMNSSSSSSVRNMYNISDNNGMRNYTSISYGPNGTVTRVSRTISSDGNNMSMNINNSQVPHDNFLFNEFDSDEEEENIFASRHRNLTNIHSNNFFHNPPINILSNQGDIESFLQHVLAGLNPEHPVEEDLLSVLPEITIEDLEKLPAEKRDCVVCLCNYEVNDKVLILPCTHIFHTCCIKDWFKSQNTCPICKYKIDRNILGAN